MYVAIVREGGREMFVGEKWGVCETQEGGGCAVRGLSVYRGRRLRCTGGVCGRRLDDQDCQFIGPAFYLVRADDGDAFTQRVQIVDRRTGTFFGIGTDEGGEFRRV